MNTNHCDATRWTEVDIELPLVLPTGTGDLLQHMDEDGVWGACPYVDTVFATIAEDRQPEPDDRGPSLEDVAAHPARWRARWFGPVCASRGVFSVSSAIRTGAVGLSEIAACGQ